MKRIKITILSIAVFMLLFSCSNYLTSLRETNELYDQVLGSEVSDIPGEYEVSTQIPEPSGIQATNGSYADQVKITWEQVFLADEELKYHVYRSDDGIEFDRITGYFPVSDRSYQDLNVESGKLYYYGIKTLSQVSLKTSRMSNIVSGCSLGYPLKVASTFKEYEKMIEVNWESALGAKFYIVKRAEEVSSGIVPLDTAFVVVSNGIKGTSFQDMAISEGGTADPSRLYYYAVVACFSPDVISNLSNYSRGALLAPGSPRQFSIVSVSKSVLKDSVRISWPEIVNLSGYVLFRISLEEYSNNNYVGSEVDLNPDFMGIGIDGNVYYYDIDPEIGTGETYYYRIAGRNEFGVGQLSPFDSLIDQDCSRGNSIGIYIGRTLNVSATQNGFLVEWDVCPGADGYWIFRTDQQNQDLLGKSVDDYNDFDWGEPIEYIKSDGTWLDPVDGYDRETVQLWYRILPGNKEVINYELDVDSVNYTIKSNYLNISNPPDLDGEADSFSDYTPVLGYSDYSAVADDYSIPIPVFVAAPAASRNKESIRNLIDITGKLSDVSNIDRLNVRLIRSCSYGDEEGVYPLYQPNPGFESPRITYNKEGQTLPNNQVEYNLNSSIDSEGNLNWLDPMPDFDENGSVKYENMEWDYKHWDREAWKHILRKKPFDIERAVIVKYSLIVERKSDASWNPLIVDNLEGYPALGEVQFSQLSMWCLTILTNRIWHLHVPRYCWSKSMDWLPGSQSSAGQHSGTIHMDVAITEMGGNGGTTDDYAEWPGFYMRMPSFELKIKLADEVPVEMNLACSIENPLYAGTMECKMWVRDYGLQWGLSDKDGNQNKGVFKVNYDNRGVVEVAPILVYAMRNTTFIDTPNVTAAKKNVHGYDLRDNRYNQFLPDNKYPWENSSLFTRIGFKYQPIPVNDQWKNSPEKDSWHMLYEYAAWE